MRSDIDSIASTLRLHYNVGMTVSIVMFVLLVTVVNQVLDKTSQFGVCSKFAVFYHFTLLGILLMGSFVDLLLDIMFVCIPQCASMYVMIPRRIYRWRGLRVDFNGPDRVRSCLLALLATWTTLVRFISNVVIAYTSSLVVVYSYLDAPGCIYPLPELEYLVCSMLIACITVVYIRLLCTIDYYTGQHDMEE